ncbi:hypothetical protein [Lysobacter xanthus]
MSPTGRTLLATAISAPLAALSVTSYVALFRSADRSCAMHQFSDLPRALPWIYLPAAAFALFYLLPTQWLIARLARGNALLLALLWLAPAALAAAESDADWSLRALFAVGSLLVVLFACRPVRSPANNSSKPTPLRGAA